MKAFEIIIEALVIFGFIGFIGWSTILVLSHTGPDESHAQTSYDEAAKLEKEEAA